MDRPNIATVQSYGDSPDENPLALPDEDVSMHVDRGGSFVLGHTAARSSNRGMLRSDTRMGSLGVRPARPIEP